MITSTYWNTRCQTPQNRKMKVKQSLHWPGQALRVPEGWGSQISRQSARECGNVIRPRHRQTLHPGNNPGTHFCQGLSRTQGHIQAGRIISIKNPNDPIVNQTRYLPVCSAVPQSIAPWKKCVRWEHNWKVVNRNSLASLVILLPTALNGHYATLHGSKWILWIFPQERITDKKARVIKHGSV
jgi:hypothetical protein